MLVLLMLNILDIVSEFWIINRVRNCWLRLLWVQILLLFCPWAWHLSQLWPSRYRLSTQ